MITENKVPLKLFVVIFMLSIFLSCSKQQSINNIGQALDNLGSTQEEIDKLHKKGILTNEERIELADMKKNVFMNGDGLIDLGKYLESKGISRVFKDFNFDVDGYIYYSEGVGRQLKRGVRVFTKTILENFKFIRCNFSGANFSGAKFKNSIIEESTFIYPNMRQVKMNNTKIILSKFEDGDFSFATFYNTIINKGSYSYNHFYKTNFYSVDLESAQFDKNVFIHSDLAGMNIKGSPSFTNTVMDRLTQNTRQSLDDFELNTKYPKVGIIWKHGYIGHTAFKAYEQIKKENAIPVRIDYNIEKSVISGYWTNSEYNQIFEDVQKDDKSLPLPQRYLANALKDKYEEHKKLREYVSDYLPNIDSVILVGGLDVRRDLYVEGYDKDNDDFYDVIHSESYIKRDYLEFVLIDELYKAGIPILGICRGAHMINIFFGGTLYPHLDIYNDGKRISGRYSDLFFTNLENSNMNMEDINDPFFEAYRSLLEKNAEVYVYSNHHQGIKDIAPGFKSSIIRKVGEVDVVYAGYLAEKGKTIWFTQFHPEIEPDAHENGFSPENANVFKLFVDKTIQHSK